LWGEISKMWLKTPFSEIDVDELSSKVENFFKMASMSVINMKGNKMALSFKERVDVLRSTIPVVTYLRDDALQDKHWEEITIIIKLTKLQLSESTFTLNSLLELNVV
jgi:dynein heavy chain, axonemal